MHYVFYRTNDVFEAEEILSAHSIHVDIVPTPVQDKAYCGVCLKSSEEEIDTIEAYLKRFDYKLVP